MNLDLLREELIRDEGERLMPYVDTVGKVTIGVGRNLTDRWDHERGITIFTHERPHDDGHSVASRDRVRELQGIGGLLGFVHTLAAIQSGEYESAALAMEAQPPEVRADLAKQQLEAWKRWGTFLDKFKGTV